MVAGLIDAMASAYKATTVQVTIAGRPVVALRVVIDHGYDIVSSGATILLAETPSWIDFRQEVVIWLGWQGYTIPAFTGFVEDDAREYYPFGQEIRAAGRLRLTQYPNPTELSYSSQTDTAIVLALLAAAGLTAGQYDIDGAGTTLGTVEPVVLPAGRPFWDLINQVDQLFGYRTFDSADGVVRRRLVSGLPAASAAFAYVQGNNILSIKRPRTIKGIHNRVVVTGLALTAGTPTATQDAVSPYIPTPPTYVPYTFQSDLIETDAIATVVATRLLAEQNRVLEEVSLEIAGNPWLTPGLTVSVLAAKVGITATTSYWVKHVQQSFEPSGWLTRLTLEGGVGSSGYVASVPPNAVFSMVVTQETWGGTTYYTVYCDGSASSDPDSAPTALTFEWSNSANGDTGTAATYATSFTAAQAALNPTITLIVTDESLNTDTITQTLDLDVVPILIRQIWVAAGSRAEVTPDGGVTWRTWTPGAGTVVSTPQIAAADGSTYFGLSGGGLYFTADYLLSTPTLIHTFDAQVNTIWINQADNRRVTVGLQDGRVWRTVDADLGASSTWTELGSAAFNDPVLQVVESSLAPGTYRAISGVSLWMTDDDFVTLVPIVTWNPGEAARFSDYSTFGRYGCATAAAPVYHEDGTAITFPALSPVVDDVRALAHHIRDDILVAIDDEGRSFVKAASASAFTQAGTLASSGVVNHMVRDPEQAMVFYAAAADGLFKTYNLGTSWVLVRDYTAAGLVGHQVGLGMVASITTTYTGRRVYMAGFNDGTSTGVPKFAWTENIYATSPAWTESSTGLPAVAQAYMTGLTIDAVESQHAYLVTSQTGVWQSILWHNATVRSAGTWANVFDYTDLAGIDPTIDRIEIVQVRTDGLTAGLIAIVGNYMLAADSVQTHGFIAHSHDYGATWTVAHLIPTGASEYLTDVTSFAIDQHGTGAVYVVAKVPFKAQIWHGTLDSLSTNGTANSGYVADLYSGFWWVGLPHEGNNYATEAYLVGVHNSSGRFRTLDAGATWATIGSAIPAAAYMRFDPEDSNVMMAAIGSSAYLSEDRGATWANGAIGLTGTARDVDMPLQGRYFVAMSAGEIGHSADWQTFVDGTGDLATIFAAATKNFWCVRADPRS